MRLREVDLFSMSLATTSKSSSVTLYHFLKSVPSTADRAMSMREFQRSASSSTAHAFPMRGQGGHADYVSRLEDVVLDHLLLSSSSSSPQSRMAHDIVQEKRPKLARESSRWRSFLLDVGASFFTAEEQQHQNNNNTDSVSPPGNWGSDLPSSAQSSTDVSLAAKSELVRAVPAAHVDPATTRVEAFRAVNSPPPSSTRATHIASPSNTSINEDEPTGRMQLNHRNLPPAPQHAEEKDSEFEATQRLLREMLHESSTTAPSPLRGNAAFHDTNDRLHSRQSERKVEPSSMRAAPVSITNNAQVTPAKQQVSNSASGSLHPIVERLLLRIQNFPPTDADVDGDKSYNSLHERVSSKCVELQTRVRSLLQAPPDVGTATSAGTSSVGQVLHRRKSREDFLKNLSYRLSNLQSLHDVQRHEQETLDMTANSLRLEVAAMTVMLRQVLSAMMRAERMLEDDAVAVSVNYGETSHLLREIQSILDEAAEE